MAQNYKTGLIITGDASGGIRAIKATDDELVKLNKGFDKGARQSKRFGNDAERAGRQLTEIDRGAGVATRGIETLRRAAAPIAGVIAGMFAANTLQNQINWGDQLQKTNLRIGASTEALSQYNYVASLSGVEFGQLTTAWQRQTRRIAEAAAGTGVASKALDRLGLSAKDLNQLAPEEQFERIAGAMQNVESSSERVALAQKLWDSEGVKLVQIVNQGSDAIAAMRAEADALGLTISQDTANSMATYNDEVDKLKFAAQGLSQTLAAELIPSMTEGLQATSAFIQEIGGAEAILHTAKDAATLLAAIMAGRYASAFVAAGQRVAANTATTKAQAQADIAATAAAKAKAAETLRVAVSEQAAAKRAYDNARATSAATGNTALRTKAINQLAAANQRAIGAEAAHTAAVNANSAAMARGTVAARTFTAAGRAASSAWMLLGGPAGAIALAGLAIYSFRDELGLTLPKIDANTTAVHKLTAGLDDMSQAAAQLTLTSLVGQLAEVRAQAEVTNETIRAVQNNDVTPTTGGFLGYSGEELLRQNEVFTEIGEASRDAEQKAANLEAAIALVEGRLGELGRRSQEVTPTITEVGDATETAAAKAKAHADAADAQASALEELRNRLISGRRETVQLARDTNTLALAMAMGRGNTAQLIQMMGLLQQKYIEGQRETDKTAKASEDASQRIANSFISWETVADNTLRNVDDSGRDAWLGLIDGSTSALDTVERAFQQTFANIAHMLTTQKLTFQVAGMMGLDTTGMPGGGGLNLGSLGGLGNIGKTVGGLFGGGATSTAAGYTGALGAATSTGYGGALGSAVSGAASTGGGFMGAASAAMPWIGAGLLADNVLGLGITDAISSGIKSIGDALGFGSKKTFDFDFQQGGNYGVFGDRQGALGDFGVTSFSDFKMDQQDELQELMNSIADFDNVLAAAAIPDRLHAMKESVDGFAYSGPEGLFDARLREIIDGSGVLIESAISQIADPQQMADALLSVLNIERVMQSLNSQIQSDVATHLEANTQDIQGTANSLTQAINATVFLGNSAERLNLQFDDTAGGAIHYAWAMQEAVGGMDALNNKSASYYQNYFTQAEREAELREQISETMRELGLEMPKTRDGFRALVEAQSLNTDAGTANVAALLQLENAFAQLVPATQDATNAIDDNATAQRSAADIAREKAQLERELLQAQGNTTALRQLELDALDESNRGIQKQIYAIKDAEQAEQERVRAQAERQRELDRQAQEAARAAEEAARAYQDAVSAAQQAVDQAKQQVQQAYQTFDQQSFDLQISYLGLVGDAEQALTMKRERELTAIDESLRPFQERLWALEDEAAAQEKAKQASRDYASELASIQTQLGSTFNSISQWIDQRNATSGTPNMNLGEAGDQFARQLELAKSGDRDALQGITEYADRYLKAGEEMYASGSGFQRIQEDVLKSLQDLPDQISAEEYLATEITNKLGEVITSFDDMIKLSLANEIERAVFASQYTIGTLIDFAVGSNDLPDDLRTVLGNQAHRLDSTINYLIGTSELSEDDRALALNVSNNLVSTVDQLLGSELGWDDKRLALNTTNTLSSTVDLTLGADVSEETRQLALLNSNTLLATINAAQADGITDETRALALNSANSIATDVNAVLGSNVSDAAKQLAISTSNNITSAVHAILTSDSSDAAMNLALNGTNTIRTFVRGLDHRLTDPDAKALALESSNYLTSTIRGVIDSRMPEAAKKLALKETNTLTTTIKAALADGKLTRDERRLIDARSESIVKRLQTGGNLNLTRDEWAVINAAGGTQRLNMLADVAFKDADIKHLDDVAKNTAEGGKSIAERAREQLESLNTLGEAMNGNVAALIGLDKSVLSLSGAINKLLNANENLLKLSMPDKPGGFGGSGRPTMPGAPDGSIADPNADPDTVAGGLGLMYQRFQSEWSRLSRNSQVANNTPDDIVNRAYRGVGGSVVAEMAQLIREIRTAGGDVSGGYIRDINPLHFFAQGGVFTNQVVSSPALFNMGLMGEAGPEAIMPLTRGSGGVLGVRAEIPPMPQLPLLDQNDVTQVLRDLVNENRMLNQRLEKIERHTGAAVQVQQAGFSRQINEQQRSNKALGDLASKARLEAAR